MGKKILLLCLCGFIAAVLLPGGHASWQKGVEMKGKVHAGKWHGEKASDTVTRSVYGK